MISGIVDVYNFPVNLQMANTWVNMIDTDGLPFCDLEFVNAVKASIQSAAYVEWLPSHQDWNRLQALAGG